MKKCKYIKCKNSSKTHTLFRFPKNDDHRLRLWVQNSGNPVLKKMTPGMLGSRQLCEIHFEERYKNANENQRRLVGTAIPIHHRGKEANEIESENDDNDDNDDGAESNQNESDENCGKESTQIEGAECLSEGTTVVKAVQTCTDCDKPINGFGFQWWCLQCGGARCSLCALRMAHRPHLLLRSPANTTPEHAQIVIEAIRKELQHEDFFKPRDAADSTGVDLDVMEEPIVKAEPPDEAEDPLAACPSSSKQTHEETHVDSNKNYELSPDLQPNCQSVDHNIDSNNHRAKESHTDSSLNISIDYQPSQKSLNLVNSLQYRQNQEYLGLDDSFERPIESLGLVESKPKPKRKGRKGLKKCTCVEESIDYRPSEKSLVLDKLLEYQPGQLFGPDDYMNYGLYSFYRDCERLWSKSDDIRHSASLQSASIGPEREASDDEQPSEDLCPPSTKRTRVETCARDEENDLPNTTEQIDHESQQSTTTSLTEDKLSNKEIGSGDKPEIDKTKPSVDEPNINRTQESLCQVYSKQKRKKSDIMDQKHDHENTQQPEVQLYSNHKKCIASSEQINYPEEPNSIKNTEDPENDISKIQQPQIRVYSAHRKQGFANNPAEKDYQNRQKSVNTTEDLKNHTQKTQLPQIKLYSRRQKLY